MIYKYRVTLEGLKGFFRVYTIDGNCSLYAFHKQLRADLEFPVDQQILFKAFDANDSVAARYALIDIGFGTVDNISIADTIKAGITKFVYFYDIVSKKSVNITFEGEAEADRKRAMPIELIESKGPVPLAFENGYVAFEDLPEEKKHLPGERCSCGKDDCDGDCDDDDDDFDDEDEDEDEDEKEDEDLIYDENEQ